VTHRPTGPGAQFYECILYLYIVNKYAHVTLINYLLTYLLTDLLYNDGCDIWSTFKRLEPVYIQRISKCAFLSELDGRGDDDGSNTGIYALSMFRMGVLKVFLKTVMESGDFKNKRWHVVNAIIRISHTYM